MRFFLCLSYMFHRRYSNCRPLNSARYNRIICQTVENTSFLGGCRAYCTRWRKVTKVTNPISHFTFLSTTKSGKSKIKNRFLDSPKGTNPKFTTISVIILDFVSTYSTVQKKCKRNSVFFVLCSRENSAKFRYEFSSKRSRIFFESNEISPLSWRNFASTEAKFRFAEISG